MPGQGGVELCQGGQAGPRAIGLAYRDGPVEAGYRAVGEAHQFVVPLDDLHPVGLLGRPGVGVQRGDGGLGLELAQAVAGEGSLEHVDALGDQAGVPQAAVLLGKRYEPAAEAIRLTRQLAAKTKHEEVAGLLALMLLHHARRPARTRPDGSLVPLAEQDRSLWDTRMIAEGVDVLQAALTRDRVGEFQAQAAIAALHADARTAAETDWVQIVEWYDELVRLTDSPIARLNRAVAVGEADGPRAGLAALAELDPSLPRHAAVAAYLHERGGDPVTAARLYAEAARSAPNLPERDHLTRQAARLNAELGG